MNMSDYLNKEINKKKQKHYWWRGWRRIIRWITLCTAKYREINRGWTEFGEGYGHDKLELGDVVSVELVGRQL